MQDQLIATYSQLMTELANLPAEVAKAQEGLTEAKRTQADTDKMLKQIEAAIALSIDGKNAEERKAKLTQALADDGRCQMVAASLRNVTTTVETLANEVAALERQYGAVCYQARLHAALLQYLGNAGAPVGKVDSLGDVMFATKTNGNSYVTAADAADLGL